MSSVNDAVTMIASRFTATYTDAHAAKRRTCFTSERRRYAPFHEITFDTSPLLPSEKTEHAIIERVHVEVQASEDEKKMIEKGLILTGSDAELLSHALLEVKAKAYEDSEAQLDDTQALDALVSCFRNTSNNSQDQGRRHSYLSPLRKRLVLGTIIDRQGEAAK